MRDVVFLLAEWGLFPLAAAYVCMCAAVAPRNGAATRVPRGLLQKADSA